MALGWGTCKLAIEKSLNSSAAWLKRLLPESFLSLASGFELKVVFTLAYSFVAFDKSLDGRTEEKT
jgi:hypothetical protein